MLKFNTLFPVRPEAEVDELISIANTWILGSPHSQLKEEEIESHKNDLEWEYSIDSETLSYIQGSSDENKAFGLRYLKLENDLRWITDIIGSKDDNKFFISVQVSCDTSNPGAFIPNPKKPYIVRQLLENIGGGPDGDL